MIVRGASADTVSFVAQVNHVVRHELRQPNRGEAVTELDAPTRRPARLPVSEASDWCKLQVEQSRKARGSQQNRQSQGEIGVDAAASAVIRNEGAARGSLS